MHETELTLVKPFYRKMMGLRAIEMTAELAETLIDVGRTVAPADVSWMLRTRLWRPVVMGAWFSLAAPAESIRDDLLAAMAASQGSLTSPPLAAAATVVAGRAAVPAMLDYINFMITGHRDGSETIVAAALDYLGSPSPIAPSVQASQAFLQLHQVAVRLRTV